MYTCIIHIWLVVPSSNLIDMGGSHPNRKRYSLLIYNMLAWNLLILIFYAHLNQQNAHVYPDGQVFTFSSREFDVSFPRKYIQNLGFKTHKVKKRQEWCNYCHLEKMCSTKTTYLK